MVFTDQLCVHHARLSDVTNRVKALLSVARQSVNMTSLAALRAEMLEALGDYQGFVHRQVLDVARSERDGAMLERAEAMKVACIVLALEYQQFALRWADRSMLNHWPEYRLSALKIIATFRDHIDECRSLALAQPGRLNAAAAQ